MTTNSVNNTIPASAAANTKPSPTSNVLASKETFLKLLVAQLKNQDPMNPSDGTQFVAQLAQFSTLEQNVSMAQDLAAIRKALEAQSVTSPPATQENANTETKQS